MSSKINFIWGFLKSITNPRVSMLSFISSDNDIHPTVSVYRKVKIKMSSIGAYTYISNDTDVECASIGKFCSIADHCRIGMSGHTLSFLSTSPIFTEAVNGTKSQWIEKDIISFDDERVYIGNDVWVGSHVLINGGVHIGDGAVIGAGAVVVKDVPPYSIVGGVPARIIRYRFAPDIIEKLLAAKWWNLPEEKIKANIEYFQSENVDSDKILMICKENNKSK